MRKSLMLLGILVCCCMLVFAQVKPITGKVTDSKGSPIPGVTVKVKGQRAGTSADAEGNFKINASSSATLIISGVGFETKEVRVGDFENLTISLRQSDASLSEVVVTALGIKREKRLLTYATQEVKGTTLVEAKQDNLVNALAGKVAGVQVTNSSGMPGSSARITIRGNSSLVGENQALFVIDGIPMDNGEAGNPDNSLFAGGTVNRASDIDPNTIESINVLKGAAATALYGSAAARGAVIITTKNGSGRGGGKPNVSFSSSYSFDGAILPKFQHQFAQGSNGVFVDGNNGGISSTSWGPNVDTLKVNGAPVKVYDNVKNFFKTGHTTDNNVTVSGNTDRSNYVVSYSYLKTDGTEPTTNYSRHSFFTKYGIKLLNNLNLSTQITYVHSDNHRLLEGNGLESPLWTIYAAPITWNPLPYLNPDGSQQLYRASRNNPYWLVDNTGLNDKTDRILPVLNLSYNPLSWLTITERLGADMYTNTTGFYENTGVVSNYPQGRIWNRTNEFQQFNNDLIIEGRKDITDKLFVDVLVGNNILTKYNNSNFIQGTELSIPGFYNISNASNVSSNYNYYKQRKVGFYAQATLEYLKMLTLSFTGRYDGSSVLSQDKQFYPYGSASAGFIFTQLLGMATNPVMNFGKIRVAYSAVGNDNVQPYSLSNPFYHYAIGNISLPVNGVNGYQLTTTYGFPLKNESLKEFEVGLETKFFQNRASLDVTYFDRKATNLLTPGTPYAPGTGFSSASLNAGDMYDRGVEVVLGFTPIRTKDLTWDITVNWSRIRNKVTRLAPGINSIQFGGFTHPGIFAFAGQPYGVIYGTSFLRDSATHKLLLDDNGYPQVDNNSTVIGNSTPNWTGGLTSTLTYKGFTFGFTLDMKQGGNILNLDNHYLYVYGTPASTAIRGTTKVFDGIIQSTGKQNTTPVVLDQSYFTNILSVADESSVEDASYLKIRQASLGYNFGNTLLKGSVVKGLALTVTATNFILHKKYSGSDPEVSLNGSGNGQGFSSFNVPSNHSIIVGLKASF
ncbi:MAG TPA: SusC/RagA family TonB-linked outer membrane protein [Puia sp.]|nr:SusC/RagA family TonB-linked outer membrane protein [Puia sp.]